MVSIPMHFRHFIATYAPKIAPGTSPESVSRFWQRFKFHAVAIPIAAVVCALRIIGAAMDIIGEMCRRYPSI